MAKYAILKIKDGHIRPTLNQFWQDLFEKRLVEALLVPLELPNRANVVQTLVRDPRKLSAASAFAPVMPVNSARIVSTMTKVTPSQKKLGLVLRPCEIRALVELVKLKQASLENTLLIGMDCFGAVSVTEYKKLAEASEDPGEQFIQAALKGEQNSQLRWNCQVCEYPVPLYADLAIGLVGVDSGKEILIAAGTESGEKALEGLGWELTDKQEKREKAVKEFLEQRRQKRASALEAARKEVAGPENLLAFLSTCIKCHNCMVNCPICYCKECFFNSPTFELEAEKYLDWARSRGGLRMPNDTLFFHLTRLSHMSSSCVACGACTEACPSDIEIAKVFTVVGSNAQKMFEYVPGRSLDEPLPLATFKEDELTEVER